MPNFLDFEQPIEELQKQIEQTQELANKSEIDVQNILTELETKISEKRKEIYSNLTPF